MLGLHTTTLLSATDETKRNRQIIIFLFVDMVKVFKLDRDIMPEKTSINKNEEKNQYGLKKRRVFYFNV